MICKIYIRPEHIKMILGHGYMSNLIWVTLYKSEGA